MGNPYCTFKLGSPVRPCRLKLLVSIVFVISILQAMVVTGSKQAIVEEPQGTRALVNSTAVLRCRVQNQHGPVTWTKDRFLLGTERSLPGYPRYSMVGSSSHGTYSSWVGFRTSDDLT